MTKSICLALQAAVTSLLGCPVTVAYYCAMRRKVWEIIQVQILMQNYNCHNMNTEGYAVMIEKKHGEICLSLENLCIFVFETNFNIAKIQRKAAFSKNFW